MNFHHQTGTGDCFPTCFANALQWFNITMTPALTKRLAVFDRGMESCTLFDPEERLAEAYGKSIQKFMSEWTWAYGHRDEAGIFPEPDEWARYLVGMGIHLELRNGPIEQRELFLRSLTSGRVAVCDIWMPSEGVASSERRHAVLILKIENGRLLIHDPLLTNWEVGIDSCMVVYGENVDGTNYTIDCDYFFDTRIDAMKPKPNPYQEDCGYRFLLVSRR